MTIYVYKQGGRGVKEGLVKQILPLVGPRDRKKLVITEKIAAINSISHSANPAMFPSINLAITYKLNSVL